jgi:hypothetical protein
MASASVPGIHGCGNRYDPSLLGALDHISLLTAGAKLDHKGFTSSIPGNCLPYHSIHSTYPVHADHEVHRVIFLPFALDAFEFFSDDTNSALTRVRQEDTFRAQNRMVHAFSRLSQGTDARKLIDGWYDGDLFAGTLHGRVVPPEWPSTVQPYPPAPP